MELNHRPVGVCSWSLKPANVDQLIAGLRTLGLSHLQLALGPLLDQSAGDRQTTLAKLRDAGITLTAGMISFAGEAYTTIDTIGRTGGIVPDEFWPARRDRVLAAGELAGEIGLGLLSFHFGFIPRQGSPTYDTLLNRASELGRALAKHKITALMETGQDDATNALAFLTDTGLNNLGVNFDPANMILYGLDDPIHALQILGPHVRHIHLKDAVASDRPRETWGKEVAFGTGSLDHAAFFRTLEEIGYRGPYVIECECEHSHEASLKTVGAGLANLRKFVGE